MESSRLNPGTQHQLSAQARQFGGAQQLALSGATVESMQPVIAVGRKGRVHALNLPAAVVFEVIEHEGDLEDAAWALASMYDISISEATAAAMEVVSKLSNLGYIAH